ncbi:hypothetical protein B4N89_24290 [Embleya scabrispora]|uniref:Uncharacterized protein n=1 Tax=Embleya scabrispora TaxID=159449 RepID=A0A1T3P3Q7_9ACTN|nr:hypothetical protein [Embleya scabrispora]OPC83644.1 hypothetical protein B4N89_24290 [Embleya scabrispora]
MAMIETREPVGERLKSGVLGLLSGGVIGGALGCFVVGCILERWQICVIGVGLFLLNMAAWAVGGRVQRTRDVRAPARLALAVIESRRALGSDTADIPVEFELTVAPDERTAYRVKMRQDLNLVDIPDYRPRGVVVVEYRPDDLWDVKLVTEPTEEWARRASVETVDSAPESAMVEAPAGDGSFCLLATLGLLVGAGIVVLLFRAELADEIGDSTTTTTSSSSSSSSETTVTSSVSASTTVSGTASSDSMLADGELRRLVGSLVSGMHTGNAATFTIDEHGISMKGVLGTPADPGAVIDVNTLPLERLPALVRTAQTKLGIAEPNSWRITFEPAAGSGAVVIRVTVTGSEGKASLEADTEGRITKRNPR